MARVTRSVNRSRSSVSSSGRPLFSRPPEEDALLLNVPEVDIQNAGLTAVNIGQVGLGPISVGQLVVSDANLSITSGRAMLRNVRVTVTLRIKVEWHVGVSMPDGIPDIDIDRTTDLGSLSFGMPVGDIELPSLNNINVNVA